MDYDISNLKYVLYRGSTAVIQSIASGLIPIYYSKKNELSIDPLFEIKEGKYIINNFKELIKVFQISKTNSTIIKYCKNFYSPLNFEIFKDLV